MLHSRSHAYVD